jgi:aspartate aminotransferase
MPGSPYRERFVAAQSRINAMHRVAAERFGDAFVDLGRSEPIAAWLHAHPDPAAAWQATRRYLPNAGLPRIRELIADHYARKFGLPLTSAHVLIAPGGQVALTTAMTALASAGDEVVIPLPYYPQYPGQVELAGATPVLVAPEDDDDPRLTAAALRRAAGPRTRAAVLNNPVNPTGVLYDAGEIEAIVDALPEGAGWLVDEAYADIVHRGRPRPCAAAVLWERPERPWLLLRSASKTVGRPALRTAVLIGSPDLIERVDSLLSLIGGSANAFGQSALPAALAEAATAPSSGAYERRLEIALDRLASTGLGHVEPQGSYYLWASGPGPGFGTMDAVERLCLEDGVFVYPGEMYGDSRAVRLSISARPRDLRDGIPRLAAHVARAAPVEVA